MGHGAELHRETKINGNTQGWVDRRVRGSGHPQEHRKPSLADKGNLGKAGVLGTKLSSCKRFGASGN